MIEVFTETKLNPLVLQKKTNSCYYNKNTDKTKKSYKNPISICKILLKPKIHRGRKRL